jgi:hypothetical protein
MNPQSIAVGVGIYLLLLVLIVVAKRSKTPQTPPALPIIQAPSEDIEVFSVVENEFVIDKDFGSVSRVMRRDETTRAIIESGGDQMISREWIDRDVSLMPFSVKGRTDLRVQSGSELLGKPLLVMKQDINLSNSLLRVDSQLVQPSATVKEYRTLMIMRPQGNQTIVTFRDTIRLVTNATNDVARAKEITESTIQQKQQTKLSTIVRLVR